MTYRHATRIEQIDWQHWQPIDRATLLFVVRDDKILLIRKKRGLGAGKIVGPGGRLEANESPHQAAVREVQEELLVTPEDISSHGELRFQFVDGHTIQLWVYRAARCLGDPQETAEAVPHWVPTTEIPYAKMWADNRLWLPLLLEKKSFEGRFIFDDDSMLAHQLSELS